MIKLTVKPIYNLSSLSNLNIKNNNQKIMKILINNFLLKKQNKLKN